MNVISVLKRQRKFLKLTQKWVAGEIGISYGSFQFYESGKRQAPLWVVEEYARLVGYELRLVVFPLEDDGRG